MSDDTALQEDIATVARNFVEKIRRVASKVPFAVEATALYFTMIDARTPLKVKATAAAALLYFIAPVDAIVDLIPFAGYTDDAAVLYAAYKAIQAHVTDEHIAAARRLLQREN
jgi:uncharacterized membrane protein YkvA (DUF1232 family)